MSRRGSEAQQTWAALAATPLYEALTIWVMAAWPEQMLDRVDTMVRTAMAGAQHVREGRWSTMRLIGVVHKAGQRPEHREVHQHLGRVGQSRQLRRRAARVGLTIRRGRDQSLRWAELSWPIYVWPWVNTATW